MILYTILYIIYIVYIVYNIHCFQYTLHILYTVYILCTICTNIDSKSNKGDAYFLSKKWVGHLFFKLSSEIYCSTPPNWNMLLPST